MPSEQIELKRVQDSFEGEMQHQEWIRQQLIERQQSAESEREKWELRRGMQLQQRFLPETREETARRFEIDWNAAWDEGNKALNKPPQVDKLKELGIADESI